MMKNIDNILQSLTAQERKYLLAQLKESLLGSISQDVKVCPCCNASNFIKQGSYKDTQKYKCKTTSKIFSYKTSSVLSGIVKLKKFEALMDLMLDKKFPTLKDIQNKIGVSSQTAHDWRTKILSAVYKNVRFDNEIIEFDETNLRLSRKGRKGMLFGRKGGKKLVGDNKYNVKVFMSYSRTSKKLDFYVSHMGRSNYIDVGNYLGMNKGLVVYSDKHGAYSRCCKARKIVHHVFTSKNHVSLKEKGVHNQTLNYYSRTLKNFLNEDLMGVSTKYLQGYLNWFMFIENCKREVMNVKEAVIENKVALDVFKQKEKEFQYFLKNNGRSNYGTYNDRYYGNVA